MCSGILQEYLKGKNKTKILSESTVRVKIFHKETTRYKVIAWIGNLDFLVNTADPQTLIYPSNNY